MLGVCADEVHLCGEERTKDLVTELASLAGDDLIIKHYTRLGPLEMSSVTIDFGGQNPKPTQLKSIKKQLKKKLRPGDCVVVFSRSNLFKLKRLIETATGKKCAVIYGSLPPDTRKRQANEFNTGGKPFLVATDAIGLGLNLHIGRIVFTEISKFDGTELRELHAHEIRQIAGRAGRYGLKQETNPGNPVPGYVVTMNKQTADRVGSCLEAELAPLSQARLSPPFGELTELAKNLLIRKISDDKTLAAHLSSVLITTSVYRKMCSGHDITGFLTPTITHAFKKLRAFSKTERLVRVAALKVIKTQQLDQLLKIDGIKNWLTKNEVYVLEILYDAYITVLNWLNEQTAIEKHHTDMTAFIGVKYSDHINVINALRKVPILPEDLEVLMNAPMASNELSTQLMTEFSRELTCSLTDMLASLELISHVTDLSSDLFFETENHDETSTELFNEVKRFLDKHGQQYVEPKNQDQLKEQEYYLTALDLSIWLAFRFKASLDIHNYLEQKRNQCSERITKSINRF